MARLVKLFNANGVGECGDQGLMSQPTPTRSVSSEVARYAK